MPGKRKRSQRTRVSPPSLVSDTVPTVNEFMWQSLRDVLKKHSRSPQQSLTKTGQNVWAEWSDLVKAMDSGPVGFVQCKPVSYEEYMRVVLTVACAVTNPIETSWDVERFVDRIQVSKVASEEIHQKEMFRLEKYFDLKKIGEKTYPCTLVDKYGRLLIWHLPGILSRNRMDDYHDAVTLIKGSLEIGDENDSSWRLNGFSDNFEIFGRGIKTFSPGWFMQAQDQLRAKLHASTSLQSQQGVEFMQMIVQVEQLCNLTLLLTAPDLYDAGVAAMENVKAGMNMFRSYETIHQWPSYYTGMQVIVNRTTPPHRDMGGSPSHYDLLVSGGTQTDARLRFREIGLDLSYPPGTIAVLCGRVFLHEVEEWGDGERICIAHMMKDNVHDRQDVARPRWPDQSRYLSIFR